MKTLKTTREVIDKLGGVAKVTRLFGFTYQQRVSNWNTSNRFPPETFLALNTLLMVQGYSAPPHLWSMLEIKAQADER